MSPSSNVVQTVAAANPTAATAATANAGKAARIIALQMLEERGRGAVLVGVARVDAALERLLQAVLLPPPGSTDTFIQPDRPLGSFGARIILAACLGGDRSADGTGAAHPCGGCATPSPTPPNRRPLPIQPMPALWPRPIEKRRSMQTGERIASKAASANKEHLIQLV